MLRSMFSAVTGLRNHQTYMDVIGNNIANVNTTGFKASRVTFEDLLSQSVRGGSVPQQDRGGTNPIQIGLGTSLAAVDAVQTQGALQSTGKSTDLAIQGSGFFVVSDGRRMLFSRDGAFELGLDGTLVNPSSGMRVQGWMAQDGIIDTAGPVGNITIPQGGGLIAKPTTSVLVTGSLSAGQDKIETTVGTFDSLGARHNIRLVFTKTGANAWTWQPLAVTDDSTVTAVTPNTATAVTFQPDGSLAPNTPNGSIGLTLNNGGQNLDLTLDLSGLTQLAGQAEVTASADGAPAGSLASFTVGRDGIINGIYTNGLTRQLGQLALATFLNPGGLNKLGGNLYEQSPNSGAPGIGQAQTNGRGEISSGFLEMSNVDLAQQFTNLIMAQRGFQANSRVITASDEMLQDLVNLKR